MHGHMAIACTTPRQPRIDHRTAMAAANGDLSALLPSKPTMDGVAPMTAVVDSETTCAFRFCDRDGVPWSQLIPMRRRSIPGVTHCGLWYTAPDMVFDRLIDRTWSFPP